MDKALISALGLKQHPDKTSIGKISKGFDFLGLKFELESVLPSKKALQRLIGLLQNKIIHLNAPLKIRFFEKIGFF